MMMLDATRAAGSLENAPGDLCLRAKEGMICRTYDPHVNCYTTAPMDPDKFVPVVRQTDDSWLTIARPTERSSAE